MKNLGFRTPPKNVKISLFQGGGRGSRIIQKFPNFFFLIRGGGRGSKQIRTFTLFILFIFFEGFPNNISLNGSLTVEIFMTCQLVQSQLSVNCPPTVESDMRQADCQHSSFLKIFTSIIIDQWNHCPSQDIDQYRDDIFNGRYAALESRLRDTL